MGPMFWPRFPCFPPQQAPSPGVHAEAPSPHPRVPPLVEAATILPSALENPATLSALSLVWCWAQAQLLSGTLAREPSLVLKRSSHFHTPSPILPAFPPRVRSACCAFSLLHRSKWWERSRKMDSAATGGSDLETSAIGRYVS